MRVVTTQVSDLNSSTACTMALKKKRDSRKDSPSLLRMRNIFLHTALVRDKFLTTANQSLSAADITRTRYLREATARAFSAYGRPLEMVTSFRYLVRVISAADNDWLAVVRNLSRTRVVWRKMARILSREGASLR